MKYTITDMRFVSGDSSVLAFLDVKFGDDEHGILIKGFTVLKSKQGAPFVSDPKKCGKDGRWFSIVDFTPTLATRLHSDILEQYSKEKAVSNV